ncbi:MAG: hypothetical protein KatS3mg076_0637 [Candidatus Binatia bacterium]|nr:MAG: hypothetical protein KatS3mg076_0637 [Candidatus Binatia bacterium]
MSGSFRILAPSPSQLEDLAALSCEAGALAWSRAALERELESPHASGLVAEAEGRLVGFLCARVLPPEAEILNLVVSPPWRRRGVARRLLGEFLESAAKEGVERVFLEVAEDNEPAKNLYRSLNFLEHGRRAGYYGPGRDALVLCRILVARGEPSRYNSRSLIISTERGAWPHVQGR